MEINTSLQRLKRYIEYEDFKGYDPYDALNSPLVRGLSLDAKALRIAFTQLFKRSPFNLRPLVGIKKDCNPKGVGLFLWGYAKLYQIKKRPQYLQKIEQLLGALKALASKGYSGACWGYNFDWQSRAFYLPRFTPTIVTSAFVGHALIDAYRYTGIEQTLDMALSIKDFILKDLNRTEEDGAICFSYSPIDHTAIHNANLLGASLLIRLFKYLNDNHIKEIALSSLAHSMKYQREDGSWTYAETDFQRWVDSFHTGFNLQGILYFLEEGFGQDYGSAFERGVRFYQDNFFLVDGTPKYYHDKVYPIDVHSASQAVVFFSRMGRSWKDLTEKVARWMINNLQDRDGFFYFQKTKHRTNKIPYIRWAQAWAFHALTEFELWHHDKNVGYQSFEAGS